jgi:RNA polymerase sigma factor for flagellar operon FliA
LFESHLAVIDRVIAVVCRRARIFGADAEDFASSVRIALLEDDCAVLRKYAGRSSFDAYLAVVIQRLLLDHRTKTLGRWRPSREAERLGAAGVLLETLLRRDLRSLDDALPIVQALDATITHARAAEMAARFPMHRPRPRPVQLAEIVAVPARDVADAAAVDAERRELSARTSGVVRDALANFSDEDATILRLRFGSGMSVADISRMLRLPQRPVYRRLETLIGRLGAAIRAAGLDAGDVSALIGEAHEMDFGLAQGENDAARQSISEETHAVEEVR